MWQPDSPVRTWKQVRSEWPDTPIAFVSPGKDSGTFDFFTEAVVGKARSIRADLTSSQDADVLVQGVVGNQHAIGYFGYAYFNQNRTMLRAVAIGQGASAVKPSRESIADGTYRPLSRPLFIYINKAALARPEIAGLAEAYLNAGAIIDEVGYVQLPPDITAAARRRLAEQRTGSVFTGQPAGLPLAALYGIETAAQPAAPAPPARVPPPVQQAAPQRETAVPAAPQQAAPPAPAVERPNTVVGVPAWQRPAPELSRARVERVRECSLALARASIDGSTTLGELTRRETELRTALDELNQAWTGAPTAPTVRQAWSRTGD
jgi:hypothetical protein